MTDIHTPAARFSFVFHTLVRENMQARRRPVQRPKTRFRGPLAMEKDLSLEGMAIPEKMLKPITVLVVYLGGRERPVKVLLCRSQITIFIVKIPSFDPKGRLESLCIK